MLVVVLVTRSLRAELAATGMKVSGKVADRVEAFLGEALLLALREAIWSADFLAAAGATLSARKSIEEVLRVGESVRGPSVPDDLVYESPHGA